MMSDELTLDYPNPSDGQESRRDYMANYQRARRENTRDIGAIPEVVNAKRRETCRNSLRLFLETYHGWSAEDFKNKTIDELRLRSFWRPWSSHHLEIIETIEKIILENGFYALAIPRGWGKTEILVCAAEWAVFYGHRRYIAVVANTASDAEKIFDKLNGHITRNELYLEDFPEVSYPIRKIEGVGQRARMQMCCGMQTHLIWSGKSRTFPTLPDSESSGACFTALSITASLRGLNRTGTHGESIRPDLIFIDDPQDRESASSSSEVQKRMEIIHSDILGLATAGSRLSMLAAVTVIESGDVADQITDPKKCPQWMSKRLPAVLRWPDKSANVLWRQYRSLCIDDMQGRGLPSHPNATEFYRVNRAEMDAGSVAAWDEFREPYQESALQWAYDKMFEMRDDRLFYSEYQQEARDRVSTDLKLDIQDILCRFDGVTPRVPGWAQLLVCGCDINPRTRGITWVVGAFSRNMRGKVLHWGEFPGGGVPLWREDCTRSMTLQDAVLWGIRQVHLQLTQMPFLTEDGREIHVSGIAYDAGHEYEAVRAACRVIGSSAIPIRGRAEKRFRYPTENELKGGKTAVYSGVVRQDYNESDRTNILHVNTDRMHHHLLRAFLIPDGSAGSLTVAGKPATEAARTFADEITSESLKRYIADDKGVLYEWVKDPGKNNEYLDCLTYCAAAALFSGAVLMSGQALAPQLSNSPETLRSAPVPEVQPPSVKQQSKPFRRAGMIRRIL